MKSKLYTVWSFIFIFIFSSCSNLIEENKVFNDTNEVSVSFNFGNSRSIVSTAAELSDYEYSLSASKDNNQELLCHRISYSDFISRTFNILKGNWTFTVTAYNGVTPVYEDSKSMNLITTENTISFSLKAVIGGTGILSVKLNYPGDKGVSRVTAKLYDDIPYSDTGEELTLNTNDSSVTFVCSEVPSGTNKILKFYLYDSQNVCIGTYIESIFIANGDNLSVERTLQNVNTFAATVYVKNNDEDWIDSGCIVNAVLNNKKYNLQAKPGTNLYSANLPVGLYKIYKGNETTETVLTVNAFEDCNATVNFSYLVSTASNISNIIRSITEDSVIYLYGEISNSTISVISNALKSANHFVSLDLSNTTGCTSLAEDAFFNCDMLKEIVLPETITGFADDVFYHCDNLEKVVLPDSLTALGFRTFSWCPKLKEINIPQTMVDLGRVAFQGCESLQEITIPAGCINGIRGSFGTCSSLKTIIVEENNPNYVSIDGILYDKNLSEIICYPAGRTDTTYSFPSTINKIAASAFSCCSNLEEIIIPEAITEIPSQAFSNCTGLTSVQIPSSVKSIGSSAFSGCSELQEIVIPDSVTYMDGSVFYECKKLTNVNLSSNISSLGYSCFKGCTSLKGITIPNSVKSFDSSVFYGCSSLETIIIPDSVANLGYGTFWGCKKLKEIAIPASITSIPTCCFVYCEELEKVILPSNLKIIGYEGFENCYKLKDINIPTSIEKIEGYAFRQCKALESITIPEKVTTIEHDTFVDCISLSEVLITSSITSIGNNAFKNCKELSAIVLPNTLENIGKEAFFGCSKLQNIEVDNENEKFCSIDGVLFNKEKNTLINYPAGKVLENYVIPSSVIVINDFAFYGCSNLQSITVPVSVNRIGKSVFYDCKKLESLTFNETANWYKTSSNEYENGTEIQVDTPSTNATNFKSYSYSSSYFYKL